MISRSRRHSATNETNGEKLRGSFGILPIAKTVGFVDF